jgi:hypothetical protein
MTDIGLDVEDIRYPRSHRNIQIIDNRDNTNAACCSQEMDDREPVGGGGGEGGATIPKTTAQVDRGSVVK